MKSSKAFRRLFAGVLTGLLILSCIIPAAFAETVPDSGIKVEVTTGQSVNYVAFNNDLGYPFINNDDRTLCPLRVVSNAMDVDVDWDELARQAIFSRTEIPVQFGEVASYLDYYVRFTIGSNEIWETYFFYTAGTEGGDVIMAYQRVSYMDTVPVIRADRTYAPIRFLAEKFGANVDWDGASQTVLIHAPTTSEWAASATEYEADRALIEIEAGDTDVADLYLQQFIKRTFGWDAEIPYELVEETQHYLEADLDETFGWLYHVGSDATGIDMTVYINDEGSTWLYDPVDESYLEWDIDQVI